MNFRDRIAYLLDKYQPDNMNYQMVFPKQTFLDDYY